ncbi:MAG TPA: right-handed parallel beta-helix repeat-containing protein [Gemmatimonadales bacterium]|nr:right-handed parallel beta-helix repeat-containing protein [Gemmatimonadales bacterium]
MRRARAVLGLALLATPLAGQAVVGLAPATILLSQGGRATVPLVANLTNAGGAQLGAYQLQVTFDPAVLRYIGVAPGAFGTPTINTANAGAGTLTLAGANAGGAGGVVTLANLTFEMLVASGSSPAAIGGPTLTAAGTFAPIAVNTVAASFCTAIGTYGDIDNNGQILGNDALIVVTAAVDLPIAPYTLTNADVDQNGTVDTRDALFILSYAVGLPTPGTRVNQPNAGACGGPAPQTLALQPSPVQLAPGDVLALIPNAVDSSGIPTAARGLAWSSKNAGVATVDTLGIVTAVANGSDSVIAQTVAGLSDTAFITVSDRHTWYVNGAVTLDPSRQLGSSAFPFATIPQALGRAAAGDTVRIAVAPGAYGPATIAKPVIVLGDSGASGMPTISNSTGAALSVNTSGRVVLQWLNLDQSNAGLDATGDTIETQSLAMNALRGPGVRVHGMQRADLRGLRVTSATLAGVWIENTASAAVSNAALSVIAARNDSAAGVVVRNSGQADLSDVTVFGVDGDGPGIVVDSADHATMTNYASNTGSGIAVDRTRFAGLSGAVLAGGGCSDPTSSHCNASIHFRADTSLVDSVQLVNPGKGIDLQPHRGSALASQAKITRSTLSSVQFGAGVQVDSVGDVTISRLTLDTALFGDGVDVRFAQQARIDSTTIRVVPRGTGVLVDPTGLVTLHHVTISGAVTGGVSVDSVQVVDLLAVHVDSSAQPDFLFLNAPARWAVRVAHADTVHADSLTLVDNIGGGLLVDSANVVLGRGSKVARNAGVGGFGGECGPNGCLCQNCIINGGAARFGPLRTLYASNSVVGIVLSNVGRGQLTNFTVDSNSRGGIQLVPANISNWTFTLDSSFLRGPNLLLAADGQLDQTGQVTVRGSQFWYGTQGIDAYSLNRFTLQASTFDSVGALGSPAISAANLGQAIFDSDTIRQGSGSGVEFGGVVSAQIVNSRIHQRAVYNINNPEAALGFNTTDSVHVVRTRIDSNAVRGIRLDGGLVAVLIDSSAVTDQATSVGMQMQSPSVILNTLIARNFVGVDYLGGTDFSQVRLSNIEGNVLAGLRNLYGLAVQADSNWWNDPLGPACQSGCAPTSAGDSATGAISPVIPFLSGPSGSAPAFAPPIRSRAAPRQQVKREGRP